MTTIKQLYNQLEQQTNNMDEDILFRAIGIRVQNILNSFPNRTFMNINDLLHYEFEVEEPEWYSQQDFGEMETNYHIFNEANDETSS